MSWESRWDPTAPGYAARQLYLRPLSWLYLLGWRGYEAVYKLGLKRPYFPKNPVVCVGSCLSGGSGKTPMVIFLAELLQEQGKKVVISCNGYGSPHQDGATVAPLGRLDAAEWGDEPSLLREALPGVPMIVGRERAKAAKLAEESFADHVLLLDDGLQHLPLGKDLQIVMLPPDVSNQHCFPAGPFRQPATDSYRFDSVLPSREFSIESISQLRLPESRIEEPHGERVQLLTAIARPERVAAALERYEFAIVRACLLWDHHPLSDGTLLQQFDPELPILVTEKDWVKLRSRPDVDRYTLWVVEHRSSVEPRSALGDWIHRELERKHSARLSRS